MNWGSQSERAERRQLGRLAGALGPAVTQLQLLVTDEAAASGELPAAHQALIWSFALVVAESCEGAGRQAARLQEQLEQLSAATGRSSVLAEAVDRVRELIRTAELGTGGESPAPAAALFVLVQLFEQLLACQDQTLRRARGAYFTPAPLVQYIVRSVDALLSLELSLPAGLATEEAVLSVIDPSCGSGAFLLGVLAELERPSAWLARHQLVGVDLLPACCRAADLLVGQMLVDQAAGANQAPVRWSAVCANVLRDQSLSHQLFDGRVPVVIGNPPYNNFGRHNRGDWILGQLESYKRGLNEKKLNLNDDMIKFLRWAQYWTDQVGRGIVAMVTNNTFLSGLTHRQMRASLLDSFDRIYVLDLHGSQKKREVTPQGSADQNVFPIQQGVAITLLVKSGSEPDDRRLYHHELWGTRAEKLHALATQDVTSTAWTELPRIRPTLYFVPRPAGRGSQYQQYRQWPRLDEIFRHYVSGVQTKRDRLFVGFTPEDVALAVREFLDQVQGGTCPAETPAWLRQRAQGVSFDTRCIRPYLVAPFDVRWVYYEPRLVGRARFGLLRWLDQQNVALVFMRQTTNPPPYDHLLITNLLVSDRVFYSAHGAPFVAPLYIGRGEERSANLQDGFVRALSARIQLPAAAIEPLNVLGWIYARLQDQDYCQRHFETLCSDFPRVAWPQDAAEFHRLSEQGRQLMGKHLRGTSVPLECRLGEHSQEPFVALRPGYPRWTAGRLELGDQQVWPEPLVADVWHARVGGYQVLPRWFKQRQGRVLTQLDQEHLRRVIAALQR